MISSTRFIRTHLANSHKKRAFLLNYIPDRESKNKYIDFHYTPQDSYRLYLPPTITDIEFIYSCDGLVCLSNDRECNVIYLWNPSTKQFKMLPAPNKNLSGLHVFLGLGFDSISNDYKLLRIGFQYPRGVEAELYSLKANSWKEIQVPKTLLYTFPSKFVHVKPGILYLESGDKILAFDLHKEVFRLYTFPSIALSNVLDFEGHVTMAIKSRDGSARSLFVLNDVCGKESWTKLFDLDVKIERVYHYLGTREFIVRFVGERGLYFYDYKTRETKKCDLQRSQRAMWAPIKYTESLVFVNGFEQQGH
ncbi:F-box protein CPR1-like [Apium graveolens]|uniref:F-box protein CPR1-like n=1 Tax=Apium graveolens TaxID=4045 RepID=UPI003D7B3512